MKAAAYHEKSMMGNPNSLETIRSHDRVSYSEANRAGKKCRIYDEGNRSWRTNRRRILYNTRNLKKTVLTC